MLYQDKIGLFATILVVSVAVLIAGLIPLLQYHFDPTWDLHAWQAMIIELTVDGVAGALIAYALHRNSRKSKEKRGKTFTFVLLDYLIPLRKDVRDFTKTIENRSGDDNYMFVHSSTPEYEKYYNNIRDYRFRINPLIFISGDSIDENHQLLLFRIVNILEMETPVDTTGALGLLYQLDSTITQYLKFNKKIINETLDLKNEHWKKELAKLVKPHMTRGDERLKKFYQDRIDANNDLVKDVLTD